ncbi:MAG: helix-turn-helix domain-containing protein [Bacillota bacterium]
MTEIGALLKKKREEKGLSYKDVQEAIKIRAHYLAALEAGDFSVIPGEVYLKGFLTNYATYLGIDRQEILAMYHRVKKGPLITEEDGSSSLYDVQSLNSKPPKYPYKLGIYVLLALVIAVGFGLYLYYFLHIKPSDESRLKKDLITEEKESLYSEKIKPEDIIEVAPAPTPRSIQNPVIRKPEPQPVTNDESLSKTAGDKIKPPENTESSVIDTDGNQTPPSTEGIQELPVGETTVDTSNEGVS